MGPRRCVAIGALMVAACGGKKHARHDAGAAATSPVASASARDAGAPAVSDARATAAQPARLEHAAWKLVDNRHTAHRAVDGELVIDGGDIGFSRYTRFGMPAPRWHLGQTVAGERAAIAEKLASLEIPLTREQAAATQLTARIHADGKQSITVKVNGKKGGKEATVALEPGWQVIAVPVAPGRLVAGENQLVFEARGRGSLALSWLRVGTIHPSPDQDPRAAAAFDGTGDAIELAGNAGLAWYVTIPEGAHLVADVSPAACHVEVTARASDDSLAGGLLGTDVRRVDLSAASGKVVRLALTARDCPRAHLTHAAITLHGPDPAPLPAAEAPRYVILWVMDALRADKIPLFTPGARAQTPNLDELARSSAVFRQYYVQGNESQVSHSSVWASVYPAVHNVRLAGTGGTWRLDGRFHVLAEELAAAGYVTTGVTGNGYVNADSGYAQGFREYRDMMRETGVENGIIYGQKIVDAALGQLAKHRDQPTYLFLGTIDTHGPWIARKPWIDIYSPGPYKGPFQDFGTAKDLGFKPGSMGCSIIPPKDDIERLRAIYDSAVSYQDQQVGRLIAQLKSWGIWDQTMLIITADHGEEMFEDTRCGHGGSLRDSLTRVPLLVHDPARFPGGTIIDEGAEGVDVMPTILAALGRQAPKDAQGEPLEPLAQGLGRGWPRPSYASMYEYAHAMRIGRWKARIGSTGVPVIDDVVADPDEHHDYTAERPVERRMLTDDLGLFLALRTQWKKSAWGVVTNLTAAGAAALDQATTP